MNPRQRRGLLLVLVAAAGAIAVFVSVAGYVEDVRTQVGPTLTALRLDGDVAAHDPITPEMVSDVTMPRRWAPPGVLTDRIQLAGMVAPTALPAGTLLQDGVLVPEPALSTGERELAILVDAETGVAGKIGPGTVVDIFATFPGSDAEPPQSAIVVQQARIVDVGLPQTEEEQDGFGGPNQVLPVTFALSVEESLQLAYIESFSEKVRLALRRPGDTESVEDARRRFQPIRGGASGDVLGPSGATAASTAGGATTTAAQVGTAAAAEVGS